MAPTGRAVPLKDRTDREFNIIALGGGLLAFNGGYMNATTTGGFRSLSTVPMTGTAISVAMRLAEGDFNAMSTSLGILVCCMTGAAVSGYLVPNRTFYLGSPYGRIFKFGTLVLIGAALVDLFYPVSIISYLMVAFVAGLQNGMTSRYSGNILRTTHISGSVTDMGLIIGRIFHGEKTNRWKIIINVVLVTSFFIGVCVASYTQDLLLDYQLFVNVVLFGLIGLCFTVFVKQEKEYRPFLRFMGCLRPKEKTAELENAEIPAECKDAESGESSAKALDIPNTNSDADAMPGSEIDSATGVSIGAPTDAEGLRDPELEPQETGVVASEAVEIEMISSGLALGVDTGDTLPSHPLSPVNPGDQKDNSSTTPRKQGIMPSVWSFEFISPPASPTGAPIDWNDAEVTKAAIAAKKANWSYTMLLGGILMLCLNAGFMNGTSIMSSQGLKTTHISGTMTKVGLNMASDNYGLASVRAFQCFFYWVGSIICGMIVPSDFYSMKVTLFIFYKSYLLSCIYIYPPPTLPCVLKLY